MKRPHWLGPRSALDNFWVQLAMGAVIGVIAAGAAIACVRMLVLVLRVSEGLCS